MNHQLFLIINGAHHAFLDVLLGIVSGLGDGLVVALLCGVLMLFRFRLGLAALLAFIVSGLLAQLLKRSFDMPRPPAVFEHVHVLGDALRSHSFPSGHATSDGVMLLLAFLVWNKHTWQAWLVASLFLLAAMGRIYGGVHFPLDVLVGLSLGVLCMWWFYRWSVRWPIEHWQQSHWWWRISGLIVVIEAAVLGLGYHIQPATAHTLTVVLPIIALVIVGQFWKTRLTVEGEHKGVDDGG